MLPLIDLADVEALTFDCYGTLIDWEAGLNAAFRAVLDAHGIAHDPEDVGAYKPAPNHFRALDAKLAELGLERKDLLHVAQSLFHDHVPAKREGLPSVWINRRHDRPGWGATPEPSEEWTYNLEFTSMAGFADAVEQAFGDAAGHGRRAGSTGR